MVENKIRTTFNKYKVVVVSFVLLVILAGCTGDFSPIDASSTGFFNEWIVYPFSQLIKWVAVLFQGSYGMSIIAITIALRLVLLPFMVNQTKQTAIGQEKMKELKPEMDAIQAKYKENKRMDQQMEMQKELSELYKKHDYHPLKMVAGCLPLLIQMPFLIGFYYAIRRTPEIANQPFLWFNLGETNLLLVAIAVLIYFIQSGVSQIGLEGAQRKQAAFMGILSPVMIGLISLTMPAALPLYWATGGLFMSVQTYFIKKYISR